MSAETTKKVEDQGVSVLLRKFLLWSGLKAEADCGPGSDWIEEGLVRTEGGLYSDRKLKLK